MGLLSPGGVHSHEDQIFALIRGAAQRGIKKIYLHAFLDGRDTPPRSAEPSIRAAQALFDELGTGRLVSLIGRYYAMDRDQRWDRLERAYNLVVRGEAPFHAADGVAGLKQAYKRDEGDEFVQPTAIHNNDEIPVSMQPQDVVIFMNFRADRARQLTRAITEAAFDGFERRSVVPLTEFVTLTRYADDIDQPCAFDQQKFNNTLGEYLAKLGKRQLRIAETEKYAHVTFFFSGGVEQPYAGEDRELIPSPKVATYDLQPEMSAVEVTDKLVQAIQSQQYDVIICNYANGDMVGHTGKFEPALQAVETLDACLGRIRDALQQSGGQMLITADHGNVEQMRDLANDQEHTAHTQNLVPLVYVGPQQVHFAERGTLADVAPTLLELMHLEVPSEMTGHSLVNIDALRSA
jgi:2,3-bisphosphoglycerate-independent phosphoglycerate mutase